MPSRSSARAIAIGEKALGPEHPDFAPGSTTSPALPATGRHAEAEPLYERAWPLARGAAETIRTWHMVRKNYAISSSEPA
jgi:hypothetical protein